MSATALEKGRTVREAFTDLAPLFHYPDNAYLQRTRHALRSLRDLEPQAWRLLSTFEREMGELERGDQQSLYISTFDLAPSCSPYLGIHVFGEESLDRARLMVGLRTTYEHRGDGDEVRELPDHIAEVLAYAATYDEREWNDLLRLVIAPALAKMDELLRTTANPYRYLVSASRALAESSLKVGDRT